MSKPVVLVTGANGEIGRTLLQRMHTDGRYRVVTVDLTPLPEKYRAFCLETYAGNIMDRYLLDQIAAHHEIEVVFHLAALPGPHLRGDGADGWHERLRSRDVA